MLTNLTRTEQGPRMIYIGSVLLLSEEHIRWGILIHETVDGQTNILLQQAFSNPVCVSHGGSA